jgi:hypothetical protein
MNRFKNLIDRWLTPYKVSLERLTVAIALISLLSIITSYALFYKSRLDFIAINGSYQTFNPVRRIFDGQIPELDFNVYLGIGTTYFITFLASLTGKNFAAINFSNHFLHLVCHSLAFLTLFYLVGLPLRRSLLLSVGLVGTITLVFGSISVLGDPPLRQWVESLKTPLVPSLALLPAWSDLLSPGLSNLGLQSALPFLTTLSLLIGIHYLQNRQKWLMVYWGSLVGLQPLWSNDYGLISALVLLAIASLYILNYGHLARKQAFLILITAAIVICFVAASLVTYGHPEFWIRNNLGGIARDQFWYYGIATSKVFSLSQILPVPVLYYYGGLLCLLTLYVCLSTTGIKPLLLLYIALTTYGAGIVSCIGGGVAIRYFIPAIFVSYFVIIFLILLVLKKLFHLLKVSSLLSSSIIQAPIQI